VRLESVRRPDRDQLSGGVLFPAYAGRAGATDFRVTARGAAAQPTTVRGQVVLERRNVGTKDCPLWVVTALATWTDTGAITS